VHRSKMGCLLTASGHNPKLPHCNSNDRSAPGSRRNLDKAALTLCTTSRHMQCSKLCNHGAAERDRGRTRQRCSLLNHLIGAGEHRRRHIEASALAVLILITSSYLIGACTAGVAWPNTGRLQALISAAAQAKTLPEHR
jgi:hypothetical protein